MSVFTHTVQSRGGATKFDFIVEAESQEAAYTMTTEKYDPEVWYVTFTSELEGTMDDFIGQKSIDRIEKGKSRIAEFEEEKKKAQERAKRG